MFFLAISIPFLIAAGTSLALPEPKPTRPFAVADDDEREAEVLAALDDLRDAVDVDDLVDHPAFAALFAALPARTALTLTLHRTLHVTSLEFQTVFARGIRERFDVAVIEVAATVEDDARDTLVLRLFGDSAPTAFADAALAPLALASFSRVEAERMVLPLASSMSCA